MFTAEHYIKDLTTHLTKHTEQVVTTLQKIVTQPFAPAVELLDFSVFTDPLRFQMTIMLFSMDRQAGEVFCEDAALFAGSVEILQDAPYYELDAALEEAFFAFYEEHSEVLEQTEQHAFTTWFATCWAQAGGPDFPLPAYVGFHDAGNSYDLQAARFVEDEDKWS